MASDRTRELAKELRHMVMRYVDREGEIDPGYDAELSGQLTAMLDAFEREMRLDEAKWWQASCNVECNGCAMTEGYPDKRIADLAAQPTPEVKK